jgi:hypothetical protein
MVHTLNPFCFEETRQNTFCPEFFRNAPARADRQPKIAVALLRGCRSEWLESIPAVKIVINPETVNESGG